MPTIYNYVLPPLKYIEPPSSLLSYFPPPILVSFIYLARTIMFKTLRETLLNSLLTLIGLGYFEGEKTWEAGRGLGDGFPPR